MLPENKIKGVWPVVVYQNGGDEPLFWVSRECVEKPYGGKFDVHAGDVVVGTPGKVNGYGESLAETVAREIHEETGGAVSVIEKKTIPIGEFNVDVTGGEFPVRVFLCPATSNGQLVDQVGKIGLDRENVGMGWERRREIDELARLGLLRGGTIEAVSMAQAALAEGDKYQYWVIRQISHR